MRVGQRREGRGAVRRVDAVVQQSAGMGRGCAGGDDVQHALNRLVLRPEYTVVFDVALCAARLHLVRPFCEQGDEFLVRGEARAHHAFSVHDQSDADQNENDELHAESVSCLPDGDELDEQDEHDDESGREDDER